MLLLRGGFVDRDAERLELQPSDLAVDRSAHRVHPGFQLAAPPHQLLDA